jgi:uncharacterized membrane protein
MLKTVLALILKNWKTTAMGIAAVLVWILNNLFGVGLTAEQIVGIQTILVTLGLFFAQDAK